jgi:adenine phosphoribosyltransferase
MQSTDVLEGDEVFIIDDVLATGGTACAAKKLVTKLGGRPHNLFLMELSHLRGREKLSSTPGMIDSLLRY